ncbi:MAG: GNAT family N-acetyltransferase, partial [Bulleidia sp.]|nr:GNAT family N-acetyltransferase [Bulleidia sp.]
MNQIREADIQDFSGIYHLVCLLEETQFDKDAMYEVFLHTLNNNTVFVSCENNIITGYLVLSITYQMHHCGKVAEVVELCVSNSFQNRKIGTDLLNHAITCAKLHGCVNMDITTNQKR